MTMSMYHSDMPHYKPWVELFAIVPEIHIESEYFSFYGSRAEELPLNLLSSHLGPGGRIFIEYQKDRETRGG